MGYYSRMAATPGNGVHDYGAQQYQAQQDETQQEPEDQPDITQEQSEVEGELPPDERAAG